MARSSGGLRVKHSVISVGRPPARDVEFPYYTLPGPFAHPRKRTHLQCYLWSDFILHQMGGANKDS